MPRICVNKPVCKRTARWGLDYELPPTHCGQCRSEHAQKDEMDIVDRRKCLATDVTCRKEAYYGHPDGKPIRCTIHKDSIPGLTDLVHKRCQNPGGCPENKLAAYAMKGNTAIRCMDHKDDTMIYVLGDVCQKCKEKRAMYGPKGGKKTFCKDCKEDGMKTVGFRPCDHCDKHPSYGLEGKPATRCFNHSEGHMVSKGAKCSWPDGRCTVAPSYGYAEFPATRCASHPEPGMVRKGPSCNWSEGCSKRPSFGFPGCRATRCKEHVDAGMEDVTHKMCETPGCSIRASYGAEMGRPRYCGEHGKPLGMENVVSRTCAECDVQPSFGFEGQGATHCKAHKKRFMVDVKSKICEHEKCDVIACVGFEWSKPLRCATHILPGMYNVVTKRCEGKDGRGGCDKMPTFGYKGGSRIRCKEHADEATMEDVGHTKCSHDGCNTRATFGIEWKTPTHCFDHCDRHTMDNVIDTRCVSCFTAVARKPHLNGHCFRCFIEEFPQNSLVRNHKTKETSVLEHLTSQFPNIQFRADKRIPGGKSKYRPDILFDVRDRYVVVEIDENQHSEYDGKEEEDRIDSIYEDLNTMGKSEFDDFSAKPLILIRFNPDKYRDGSKLVKSCWKHSTKTNLACISDEESWNDRLQVLKTTIDALIDHPVETLEKIHEIKLFYNNNTVLPNGNEDNAFQ